MSSEAEREMYRQATRQFPGNSWKTTIPNWERMSVTQQDSAVRSWVRAKGLNGTRGMAEEYANRVLNVYRRECAADPTRCY